MAAALTLLLIGCLLQGALCGDFKITVPQTIKVLRGSCVTIPCSFDIQESYISALNNTCKAVWKTDNTVMFDSNEPRRSKVTGHLTGHLTKKDCTTTLNNMQYQHSNKYHLRLQCQNTLRYEFKEEFQKVDILVRDDLHSPTLTPSTLQVNEGASVSLTCSAPAPCLSHPPLLTWTPSLGDSQETLQENHNKTTVKTSAMNFSASHLHHRQEILCTAVYEKQDGSTNSSVSTSLTADISFAPHILPSSDCTRTADQVNCSCKTVGNPPPTLQWFLDGLPVNHSDKFAISYERLNDTRLSFITASQPQWKDLSTLLCYSSNSLGSATQRFYFYSLEMKTSAKSHDIMTLPAFITTIVALLVLVCALLFVIRAQKTHHDLPKSQCTGVTSPVAMSQLLTNGEQNEVPNTTEDVIYANTNELRQSDIPATISEANRTNLPSSGPNKKKNEEGTDVTYSSVNWKSKKKKKGEDSGDRNVSSCFYLEEERSMVGGMRRNYVSNALEMGSLYDDVEPRYMNKEVECEYAHVKYKDTSALHK